MIYLFYQYVNAKCSTELADVVLPLRIDVGTDRGYSIVFFVLPIAIGSFINLFSSLYTAVLWNPLPRNCLPSLYNV